MEIYLLDMGQTKYGDCIFIKHENIQVLIDGGHPGDSNAIKFQLSKITRQTLPIRIDLLVVTHCHSDHIGCLPDLVSLGIIDVRRALVADENIGWGTARGANDGVADTHRPTFQDALLTALQEEDFSDMPDEDIEQFLFDALTLRQKYEQMLSRFNGIEVIRYGLHRPEQIANLENDFANIGLKILGPDIEHLKICHDAIEQSNGSTADAFTWDSDATEPDLTELVKTYKALVKRSAVDNNVGLEDRPGIGAAKNNQSIVLKVQADDWSALLAGDMQFAKAEVSELKDNMSTLLQNVNDNGPYDFIKLTHHTSYNGLNEQILEEWNKHTVLFAHTGGRNDPSHPDEGVLQLLEKYKEQLYFLRTDRNGLITVKRGDEDVEIYAERGDVNDFSSNIERDKVITSSTALTTSPTAAPALPSENPVVASPFIINEVATQGVVEVTAKIPHTATKVTLTVEVEPSKKKMVNDEVINVLPEEERTVNPTERFSGLLFITSWKLLEQSVGRSIQPIKDKIASFKDCIVLDYPDPLATAEEYARKVRQIIAEARAGIKGIVILGGYDIIPAEQLDVLDPKLREGIENEGMIDKDMDNFIVWSDDVYGDTDNDDLAELPVSRIPDAKSYELIEAALNAPRFKPVTKFGIRNYMRPFAQNVFKDIPGGQNAIEISPTFGPDNVVNNENCGSVYYMLHGSDVDGTKYWGENPGKQYFEAYNIRNVPRKASGSVIFTGCCWAALTAFPSAAKKTNFIKIRQKKPTESIALAYLKAGVLSFVGCTGSHYSPNISPFNYHGKPMHDHFWKGILTNKSPAEALHYAKVQYSKEIPHGLEAAFNLGVELKILRQFTCLGLGW